MDTNTTAVGTGAVENRAVVVRIARAMPPAPVPARAPARTDRVLWLVVLLIGIPAAAVWALAVYRSDGSPAAPDWVTPDQIRATTRDGIGVRAKVSMDVPDMSVCMDIERRRSQVGLLLQASVAGHDRRQLSGPDGLERLSDDMRDRMNDYLASDGSEPVRSVAVQHILFTKP